MRASNDRRRAAIITVARYVLRRARPALINTPDCVFSFPAFSSCRGGAGRVSQGELREPWCLIDDERNPRARIR